MKFNTPGTFTTILAATTLLLAGASHAKPKLTEIQGLPVIGPPISDALIYPISQIRSGADAEGNVLVSWVRDSSLFLQKLPRADNSATEPTKIADLTYLQFPSDHDRTQDLVVNSDGSYLLGWLAGAYSSIKALPPGDPTNVIDLASGGSTLWLFPKNDSSFATVSNQTARFFDQSGREQAPSQDLGYFAAASMNNQGQFFLLSWNYKHGDTLRYDVLVLWNGTEGPGTIGQIIAPFAGDIQTYDFKESPDRMKSLQMLRYSPKIAINAHGEILVTWIEAIEYRKRPAPCYYSFGCADFLMHGVYRLAAQRFDSDLSPIDPKPLLVASIKQGENRNSSSVYRDLFQPPPYSVALDTDGDFVLAYNDNFMSIYGRDSKLVARQFITNNQGKLIAGKVIKLSNKPKTSHPAEKGKVLFSNDSEPSVAITNSASNEFMVTWHNDYIDQYQDPNNFVDVCTRSTSTSDCNRWKHVHKTISEGYSALKAVRYGAQ